MALSPAEAATNWRFRLAYEFGSWGQAAACGRDAEVVVQAAAFRLQEPWRWRIDGGEVAEVERWL